MPELGEIRHGLVEYGDGFACDEASCANLLRIDAGMLGSVGH
jgi:hypothetical protein